MSKKLTIEDFLKRAQKVHGNTYDYSKVIYIKQYEKVEIICPIHGSFFQTPANHWTGRKCHYCANNKHLTLEDFIKKSNLKHNFKYDYSKSKYINRKEKIEIICPIHGEFWQEAGGHMEGKECFNCTGTPKKSLETFIKEANEVHNFKYNYSKVNYKDNKTKICIICPVHGEFYKDPKEHIYRKSGCQKCAKKYRITTTEELIYQMSLIHDYKYDYSKTSIKKSTREKIIVICKEHGEFKQTAYLHLRGKGCHHCGGSYPLNTEKFIQRSIEIHGPIYDYSESNYVNAPTKIKIKCFKHGPFWQLPNNHWAGKGCRKCSSRKNEKIVLTFLKNNNIDFKHNYHLKLNDKNIYVDFYLKNLNLFIEYNGEQHYSPVKFGGMSQENADMQFKIQIERDEKLREYCKLNNIELLEIDGRIYQFNKLKEFLKNFFKEKLIKSPLPSMPKPS